MAEIYQHIPRSPDRKLGTVDAHNGRVTGERFGPDEYIGRVDYDNGKVYRHRRLAADAEIGRVAHDGRIYASRVGPDQYVGRVNNDGRIYRHVALGGDEYLGKVERMQHPVEGAAAMLFFLLPEDEEVEEDAG